MVSKYHPQLLKQITWYSKYYELWENQNKLLDLIEGGGGGGSIGGLLGGGGGGQQYTMMYELIPDSDSHMVMNCNCIY